MPTYGWVREDAWEAFLEGTAPRGGGIPAPHTPRSPSFSCPFCAHTFSDVSRLQNHFVEEHRITRPLFLIDGKEAETDSTLRNQYPASHFSVANATTIKIGIDGSLMRDVSAKRLASELSKLKQATAWIVLINAAERHAIPVTSEYRLSIRIAEDDILKGVEQAFLEKIVDAPLSMSAVANFLADPRCADSGRDYADSIAEYVTGVLVKERPDGQNITSPLKRYRDLYGSALQGLQSHRRPLPRLLCTLMRFAMNNLSGTPAPTGVWELDVAMAMLRGPEHKLAAGIPADDGRLPRRRICLIDHGTGRILDLAARLAQQDRWSPTLVEECRQVAEAETLDIMDRQKAHALWALTALRLGAFKDAIAPLSQLSATYPFSNWAEPSLEAVSK